jgi:Mg2+/Co2+ transporter CorB
VEAAPSIVLIVSLIVLLVIIAFSSGTEVAMLSVNRYRIRARAEKGQRRARALESLLNKPDDWLGANLVILALASVAASSVATLLALRLDLPYALPVMMALLTVFMIVFCELAPKIYAALRPEFVALSATYIYRALVSAARPLLWLTNQMAYGFLRLFGVMRSARSEPTLSPDELRTVVAEAGPMIPSRHRQMLLSILDLERVTVNDIMIPRQEISGIDLDDDWEDILDHLKQTPHTRLPVFQGDIDNIVGILHMKRAAQEFARGSLDRDKIEELARGREPYFVPEGTSLTVQLAAFQRNRRRFGFVVDEYGDIQGLVTLEDLLEEIVGEFTTDPATVTHKDIHQESAGTYIINASATVRAVNRALGWQIPTDGPKTLNGVLLEQLETIPQPGAKLRIGDLGFEVLQIADNAIRTVRVRAPAKR